MSCRPNCYLNFLSRSPVALCSSNCITLHSLATRPTSLCCWPRRRSVPSQAPPGGHTRVLPLLYSPGFKPQSATLWQVIDRAVKVLDQMPPYDTHKIGVVFVGAGQVRDTHTQINGIDPCSLCETCDKPQQFIFLSLFRQMHLESVDCCL